MCINKKSWKALSTHGIFDENSRTIFLTHLKMQSLQVGYEIIILWFDGELHLQGRWHSFDLSIQCKIVWEIVGQHDLFLVRGSHSVLIWIMVLDQVIVNLVPQHRTYMLDEGRSCRSFLILPATLNVLICVWCIAIISLNMRLYQNIGFWI